VAPGCHDWVTRPVRRGNLDDVTYGRVRQGAIERTYRVHRPRRLCLSPRLALVLHGAVGAAEEIAGVTGFDLEADRLGWVVAYPEAHNPGVNGGWDTYACCKQPGVDDVAFIATLIDELERSEGIDPKRVCVAGFSRGGMMAYRLGCEIADRLAAIAPVAGNMADASGSVEVGRRPDRPVAVLAVHGLADRNVPVEGGPSPEYPEQVQYAPLSDVLRKWREWNGCIQAREQVALDGAVTVRRWPHESATPVGLRLVHRCGHAWPRGNRATPASGSAFDASRAIADFFAVAAG
jgi:polyhydroxybutyrate depolymerase